MEIPSLFVKHWQDGGCSADDAELPGGPSAWEPVPVFRGQNWHQNHGKIIGKPWENHRKTTILDHLVDPQWQEFQKSMKSITVCNETYQSAPVISSVSTFSAGTIPLRWHSMLHHCCTAVWVWSSAARTPLLVSWLWTAFVFFQKVCAALLGCRKVASRWQHKHAWTCSHAALSAAIICFTKSHDFEPWAHGFGRLTELPIEQFFSFCRRQSENSQLTARAYWQASARQCLKMEKAHLWFWDVWSTPNLGFVCHL